MPASARYKIHYVLFSLTYNNYRSNNIKPNKNKKTDVYGVQEYILIDLKRLCVVFD